MTIIRAIKIWFFTNLLGALLLLFVSDERGLLDPRFFLIAIAGGVVSLPAIILITLNIRFLKKLPMDPALRTAYMMTSTALIALAILLLIMILTGHLSVPIWFLRTSLVFLYPYCITAILTSLYFTRDLLFVEKEEETIRLKEVTDYERE